MGCLCLPESESRQFSRFTYRAKQGIISAVISGKFKDWRCKRVTHEEYDRLAAIQSSSNY